MQVCTSYQTDNHASTPPLSFFTGRMPFLPPNQQRQSTEGLFVSFSMHNYTVTSCCGNGSERQYRVAASANVGLSYLPGGADAQPYLIHDSLSQSELAFAGCPMYFFLFQYTTIQ